MTRVAYRHDDLFAPARYPAAPIPETEPLTELQEMLAMLRTADVLPWPDAAATMAQERRALGLAKLAGEQGAELAAAILDQTERLLAATD